MSEKKKDRSADEGRRDALKKILGLSAGLAAVSALPAEWSPAVVETVAQPPGHGGGRGRGHCDNRGRGRGHAGDDCGPSPTEPPSTEPPPTEPPGPTPPPPTTGPPPV